MKEKRKINSFYSVYGIVSAALIIAVMALHLALPDQNYSSTEKRNLAKVPEISFATITDGSLMNKIEDYVADQFPARDLFMKMKTRLMLLLGNRESQGVYYCKDGSLIEAFEPYDEELLEKTVESMNEFNGKGYFENAYVLISPTAAGVNQDLLPSFATQADQYEYIEKFESGLTGVTILETDEAFQNMKNDGREIFYKTDHHWTTDAAFEVYKANAERCNYEVGEYKTGFLATDFRGSLVSKSGFLPKQYDAVTIYENTDENLKALVTHMADNTASGSVYQLDSLSSDNPYEVFFGGNEPMITIQTTAKGNRTLLIFKDSYANCFIPFLMEDYKMITIIDPRYYTDTVSTLFTQQQFNDVMYLYNASTLSSDQNLWMVLKE